MLISHASKVMLKIFQARLQQYENFQMYKVDLEKAEEPKIKLPTSIGSQKKQGNSRKTSTSAALTKAFDCVDHNKVWKILKEMGNQDRLTCLLRNLYADQEATVRIRHETTDWFKTGNQFVTLLINIYAGYIM